MNNPETTFEEYRPLRPLYFQSNTIDNIKDLSLADVIFLSTSSRLICLKMNLVPLSSARKRISLLSTVNNLSTMGENCGYRHSPSQQTPLGTLLRGEKIIQGQVLPFQIKIPSDFRVFKA